MDGRVQVKLMKATYEERNAFLNDDFDYVIEDLKKGEVLDWVESGSPMCIYFVCFSEIRQVLD